MHISTNVALISLWTVFMRVNEIKSDIICLLNWRYRQFSYANSAWRNTLADWEKYICISAEGNRKFCMLKQGIPTTCLLWGLQMVAPKSSFYLKTQRKVDTISEIDLLLSILPYLDNQYRIICSKVILVLKWMFWNECPLFIALLIR